MKSELHSIINNVSYFFAELDNSFGRVEEHFLIFFLYSQ